MGTMARRRVTYKVYPNKQQEELLENTRRMHCDLYNAALEERITAYRRRGISVKKADQEKSLTQIRQQDPL
ncbi:helix-turn-helix domain-containing protein, partial [Salipiger mucosus]